MIGQLVLDRYVVEEELGRGAMGIVYRGRHVNLRRHVAIKVMHEHLRGQRTLLERFRREARLAGKLAHANVIAVVDVGETADGNPVMVMEYARGRSLGSTMSGPVPRERMVRLLKQLLLGLDHAHAMGFVHRDLKPENVILQGDLEVVRIVDFGIAVLRGGDEEQGGKLTGTGMIVGTPLYMAPEQAKAEPIDQRADLYALGIIMYEMVAGMTPFDGSAMEIAVQKIEHDPPPVGQRVPGMVVDRVLDAFMRKLLARDVAARFSSAMEALRVLELFERDRMAAAAALGVIDVDRALSVIELPDPPR
ncbi:MAG TPA: serine/threonine-protein kinase [Kofleriaceae bacterium]|nr:serine/threonine-protein kinase [Kofleriaceae bacterium]